MTSSRAGTTGGAEHWDEVYQRADPARVSWYEPAPGTSMRLILSEVPAPRSVVDVGVGTSTLADSLLAAGVPDVTVLDVSASALAHVRARLDRSGVTFVRADVTRWAPERTWQVWHDRAVLHFLTDRDDRTRYVAVMRAALEPGGIAVVGTFAADGPEQCSGLPTARYDASDLVEVLGTGFVPIHHERVVHRTPDGRSQPFTWVVARRS